MLIIPLEFVSFDLTSDIAGTIIYYEHKLIIPSGIGGFVRRVENHA